MYTIISAIFANEETDLEAGTYPRIRNYEYNLVVIIYLFHLNSNYCF